MITLSGKRELFAFFGLLSDLSTVCFGSMLFPFRGGRVWRMCHVYILRHRDVQLILAYSCARLAILVAGKARGEFVHFFPFIPVPLSSLSLSLISTTISSSFPRETTQNDPQGLTCRLTST